MKKNLVKFYYVDPLFDWCNRTEQEPELPNMIGEVGAKVGLGVKNTFWRKVGLCVQSREK